MLNFVNGVLCVLGNIVRYVRYTLYKFANSEQKTNILWNDRFIQNNYRYMEYIFVNNLNGLKTFTKKSRSFHEIMKVSRIRETVHIIISRFCYFMIHIKTAFKHRCVSHTENRSSSLKARNHALS